MAMPFSLWHGCCPDGPPDSPVGQVRDQIRGVHGDIKDLNGRIERVEGRLSSEIKAVRIEVNGRIDQVRGEMSGRIDQVSGDIKEVRGEVTFIKSHLSAVLALSFSKSG